MSSSPDTSQAKPDERLCHFCEQRKGDRDSVIVVNLHTQVAERPIKGTTSEKTWRRATIQVPRCASCAWYHDEADSQEDDDDEADDDDELESQAAKEKKQALPIVYGFFAGFAVFVIGYLGSWLSNSSADAFLNSNVAVLGISLAVAVAVGVVSAIVMESGRSAARSVDAALSYPPVAERISQNWTFGAGPDQTDRFSSGGRGGESVVVEDCSESNGCPQCGMPHWWNDGKCAFCQAGPSAEVEPVDWEALHESLALLMRLKTAPASQVFAALGRGERDAAARILVEEGTDAEDACRVLSVWQRTSQAA